MREPSLRRIEIALAATDVVAMSTATRDFHPVHRDLEVARRLGHPDVFLNMMTTAGLVERCVHTWFGAGAQLLVLKLKLGVPHYAGDVLVFEGEVGEQGRDWAEVAFTGTNGRGRHASGTVRVAVFRPSGER